MLECELMENSVLCFGSRFPHRDLQEYAVQHLPRAHVVSQLADTDWRAIAYVRPQRTAGRIFWFIRNMLAGS